jgi:uncharacterized protein (TIGR02186 family)
MKIIALLAFFILFLNPAFLNSAFLNSAQARPIISGISSGEINIDSKFTGAEILLFGAKGDAGNIIVAVRGPKKNYMLNKKGQVLGVWLNEKRIKFKDTYSYYSIFSTNNYDLINDAKLFNNLEVGQDNIQFNLSGKIKPSEEQAFRREFLNKLEESHLYSFNPSKIEFLDETLFKVILQFPKNIASGIYTVEIYLIDEGNLSAFQSIPIFVNQVGFSAKIHDMAYNNSFLYGLLAVMIAVISGWSANFIFNKFFGK